MLLLAHSRLHPLLNFAALHLLAEPWRAAKRCCRPVIRMKVKPMVILRTVCPGSASWPPLSVPQMQRYGLITGDSAVSAEGQIRSVGPTAVSAGHPCDR